MNNLRSQFIKNVRFGRREFVFETGDYRMVAYAS